MIVKLQDDADDEKQASQRDSLLAGIPFTDAGPTENISPITPVCNGQPDLEPSGRAIYQLADERGDGSARQFALRWVLNIDLASMPISKVENEPHELIYAWRDGLDLTRERLL